MSDKLIEKEVKRDYKEYSDESTVIQTFEEYLTTLDHEYGPGWEDFADAFLCFRAGFMAGGCN